MIGRWLAWRGDWRIIRLPHVYCVQQFPSPSSAVRICSTLDNQTAVTEGQKDENPDFCFILASAPFHETPRLGQIGMAQSTLTCSKTFGTQNIESPHPGLSPCVTSRWFLRILGRSPRSRNQLAGARHSWRIGRTVSPSHVDRGISMFNLPHHRLTPPPIHDSIWDFLAVFSQVTVCLAGLPSLDLVASRYPCTVLSRLSIRILNQFTQ